MKKLAITIISVVYNAREDLRSTLNNLSAIREQFDELIVIDGGSSDGTPELVRDYSSIVNIIVSERDNGIYDAMNKGWNLAKLENHVLFLGAGDKIISLPDLAGRSSKDIVYGDVYLGEISRRFIGKASKLLLLGNTLHHQALLIPKILSPVSPFNTSFKTYADFDLNQRLFLQNENFIKLENFVAYAQEGGVSSVLNIEEMVSVVRRNCGITTAIASYFYLAAQKLKAMILS